MKASFFVRAGLSAALLVPLALGQGRGAGGGGMQGQGRQGMGQPTYGAGRQDRARVRGQASQQQQDQYRVCTQAMSRVRKHIRAMARTTSASNIDLQQARDLQQQLTADLQAMQQEQQSFTESLSEEQKTANQTRLQKMLESQKDLDSFSEALGFELDQAAVDSGKIQEQVRNLDKQSRTLEKQQHELAVDLGMD